MKCPLCNTQLTQDDLSCCPECTEHLDAENIDIEEFLQEDTLREISEDELFGYLSDDFDI